MPFEQCVPDLEQPMNCSEILGSNEGTRVGNCEPFRFIQLPFETSKCKWTLTRPKGARTDHKQLEHRGKFITKYKLY